MKLKLFFLFFSLFVNSIHSQDINDNCSGAILLTVNLDCNSAIYSFENNTNGADECSDIGVWFSAIVPASGSLNFSTTNLGSNENTEIKVYAGSCGSLTLLSDDCQDDDNSGYEDHEEIELSGRTPGEMLYFVVDDNGGGGTFSLCLFDPATIQTPSDDCINATPLTLTDRCIPSVYTFDGATNETDECSDIGVWFQVVVPASGIVFFSTTAPGSNTDTEIKVYTGSCGNFTLLSDDCQDDDNTVHNNHESFGLIEATPGETIYLVVDDRGNGGTFSLCAFSPTPNPPGIRNKFSVNFDNSLDNICGNGSLSTIGNTGSFQPDPLLNGETVYCFGEDDGLSFDPDILALNGEYSIELYFRFDDFTGYQRLFDASDATNDNGLYTRDDELRFYEYSSTNPTVFTSTSQYYHVVMTYLGGVIRLYVNGNLYETIADASGHAFPGNNFIFFKDDGGEDEAGCVRMINIYDYALSDSEVSQLALNPTDEECMVNNIIPTVSLWGIIILSMIMLIFGIVASDQRKMAFE